MLNSILIKNKKMLIRMKFSKFPKWVNTKPKAADQVGSGNIKTKTTQNFPAQD